jgi:hypothetical protein
MKHFNLKILVALCVASVYFVGCRPCGGGDCCNTKLNCGANGTCFEEGCTCSDGYEGQVCDTLSSLKFVGHWKGQEVYYKNGQRDTVAIDWLVQTTSQPATLKITTANNAIITPKVNKDILYSISQTVLDSSHIVTNGKAGINTTKNKINYTFYYKAIDTIPAFSGNGMLVKQ